MRLPFRRRRAHDDAFDRLLQPHLAGLFQLALRLTGHRDRAEDLVQELCTRFLPRLETLETLDDPRSWLARALYRLFVDHYRREQRNPVESVDELPEIATAEVGPEAAALNACTQEQLQQALDRLSPPARDLVIWVDLEGHRLDELSETLETPLGTLKARLHRARQALRQDLMQLFDADVRVSR